MTDIRVPRRLWHETSDGRAQLDEIDLPGHVEPLIVLGEAGMGKTKLLSWLGEQEGHAFCTARQLKNCRPDPRGLLGNATTLVIDALDELSVQGESDAVDIVLEKLGDAGYPRFVLSCRASDWRNATGVGAIREQYAGAGPLVLHLEPLTDDDVLRILSAAVTGGEPRAQEVMRHFDEHGLNGLLANPQTLELVARVANAGPLPIDKADLFGKAVELLRHEHRDSKVPLQLDEATALDAAGGAFATLILTGNEALVIETAYPEDGELPLAEVAALPRAGKLDRVLGSRLFSGSARRFSYWHRRIGEYLGAKWLVRIADNPLKKKRLLAMFRSRGVVPASLRGLHAWLAHHDGDLAAEVITADPMGVIEYGDADGLSPDNARHFLRALGALSRENPNFRDWRRYSLRSITQPELLTDIRGMLLGDDVQFNLRSLVLETLPGTAMAEQLRVELRAILLDSTRPVVHRSRAADVLVSLGGEDWRSHIATLRAQGDANAIRLAFEIVDEVGVAITDDETLVTLSIRQQQIDSNSVGLFIKLQRAMPDERLEGFLDELAMQLGSIASNERGHSEIVDLGYRLAVRRVRLGETDARRLLAWLAPLSDRYGYNRDARGELAGLVAGDDPLRVAGLRITLLEGPTDESIRSRAFTLFTRNNGFTPKPKDIVQLLGEIETVGPQDNRWRDLLELVRHSATEGAEVREAAKRHVANRADMIAWIDRLIEPRVPDWEIRQEEDRRKRRARDEMAWREHREEYRRCADEIRRGDRNPLITLAQAYLNHFHNLPEAEVPHERMVAWLGEDLAAIASEGFEAFICSDQGPTATEIAEENANSVALFAALIIVAGLAERLRLGLGLENVSDDRLTSAFHELRRSRIDDHAKLPELLPAVEAEMDARGLTRDAERDWLERQIAHRRSFIDRLHSLMNREAEADFATEMALRWLETYPDIPKDPEQDLIDRLIRSHHLEDLRRIGVERIAREIDVDRRRNWDAALLLTDFEAQRDRLTQIAAADPEWLWTIRSRLGGDQHRAVTAQLPPPQLSWLFETFRPLFPAVPHPTGAVRSGETPWEASDYLSGVASRLAEATTDEAIEALTRLRDATVDGYTIHLRTIAAEQRNRHAERLYTPPTLPEVRTVVEAGPPATVADLQATMVVLLNSVQKRIVSDPADPWRGFYGDDGVPYDEERCRDHLLTMLGVRPSSIDLMPEGHLADDNRADIICTLSGMRLPMEVKGQWHPEVWRAADDQLDRLYTPDYAAERRGIYLVLWFGPDFPEGKKPRANGLGRRRPTDPDEVAAELAAMSRAVQDGRVEVLVLDLRKPGGEE